VGSKVILYGDPSDSRGNYLTPTYYKKDESDTSIATKRMDDPDYKGYKKGQYSKSSPHFDVENLRVLSSPDQAGQDFDVSFPGLVYPDTSGERITSGTEMRRAAYCGDVDSFIAGLPEFVKNDPELKQIYLDEFMKDCQLNEIKRAEKGTHEYSSYLEELMGELQYVKSSYESRKKTGARYRKEASKIQDAYSELRRLKRKNDRKLNAEKINEVVNSKNYTSNVELSDKKKFNSDEIREFLRKIK
jgi:hypothetical protein